ncbi:type II CAAX endopeptidase family protein [Paenibacillus sp. FSL L8-0436]|uniref:CPBP family intramembrane glutamic endopeptidase n=1 Tax=Paenibacillus sp. FSL L8-0436 TaxID=2954686 RepID=UPI00315932A0
MSEKSMRAGLSRGKALLAVVGGILVLVLAQVIASLIYLLPFPHTVSIVLYYLLYIALAYLGVKLLSERMLKLSLQECRIHRPRAAARWLLCAVTLPVAVSAILLCLPGEFIPGNMDGGETALIIVTAIVGTGLSAGIVEEMIFRGILMKSLELQWGKTVAIWVPSVIFGLIHAIGAGLNAADLLLLFVGGTSVGIMFSLIVYRSGSIWSSAIVHAVWNMVMIGDILHIGTKPVEHVILSYRLTSDSTLLTGGNFGVELSAAAIAGYWSVIAVILYLSKKRSTQPLNVPTSLR